MSTVHNIVVVLNLNSRAGIPTLLARATAITSAMQSNPKLFPSPVPSITQAETDIAALTDAQTAFKSHLGTRTVRDDKQLVVVADMKQYHAYVQQLANANPAQAQVIADAATMTLRKVAALHKADLAVKQTVSGSVKVVAKAVKGAHAHNWQTSTDGGKTWLDAPDTLQATTTIHGLTPGVVVTYRHRPLLKTGPADWSQPVSAIVT
jgi:hypothetical protein